MDILEELRALIAAAPKELEEPDENGLRERFPYERVVGNYKDVPQDVKRLHAAKHEKAIEIKSAEDAHAPTESHAAGDDDCKAFHREVGWMKFKYEMLKVAFFASLGNQFGLCPAIDFYGITKGGEIVVFDTEAFKDFQASKEAVREALKDIKES